MFTGIVETVGTLQDVRTEGGRAVLCVDVGSEIASGVKIGDSVALSGCCLTVTRIRGDVLEFDAIPETLRRTSIGDLDAGDHLNVERALRADARLDGHIVQGHVDAAGTVEELRREGEDVLLRIRCPDEVAELLVQKGSVAVDGVSLTVVDPGAQGFQVALIPHTLAVTTLGERAPGDRVNLEVDVLGKYVHQYLARRGAG